MLRITNAKDIYGKISSKEIASLEDREIDGQGRLFLLPAVIDGHVHFRTPGAQHKEDWLSASTAAIKGGVATVFDMPNTTPPCTTQKALMQKKELIEEQLQRSGIPLRYYLYFGASKDSIDEIEKVKDACIGIKVFMGSSTGDLLIDDTETLNTIFRTAADLDMIVAVHAEDEKIIHQRQQALLHEKGPSTHSIIRSREAARKACEEAIDLSTRYGTKLYLLHVSTQEEISLIAEAKRERLPVFAEVTPHHLFLDESVYQHLGTKAIVNPPLRTSIDRDALWQGILDGTVDCIGSDHAPHTSKEKSHSYPQTPAGMPGIETLLPLLLDAHAKGRLSLEKIVALTHTNIKNIFNISDHDDVILVDLDSIQNVDERHLATKCGWSPFQGWPLQGWPVCTIINGQMFPIIEKLI